MAIETWTARFSERQTEALDLLESPDVEELLYGGAKGGGKSVAGVQWLYLECRRIIERFGLGDRQHPIAVAFMGRKRSVDFCKTTLETWRRFIPAGGYEIRDHTREVVIGQAVKIDYGGLDDTTAVSKFNSAEYARVFLDQAEEITPDDIAMLRGSLGRLRINGQPVGAKLLLTANPVRDSWLMEFVDPARRGSHQRFVKALPTDNPWLEAGYIDRLKRAFKDQPDVLAAYLEGQWEPPPAVPAMTLSEAEALQDLFMWELELAGTQPMIPIPGVPFKVDPSKIRPRPPGPSIEEVWPRLWAARQIINRAKGRPVAEQPGPRHPVCVGG